MKLAHAGVLLARVTQIKHKGEITYVGVNAGMNSLIRPALYGAHHSIVNLSRLDEPASMVANVVGPICESGDFLARDRELALPHEGDLLAVHTVGAYGFAMASNYNSRPRAAEVVVDGSDVVLARRRETLDDLIRGERLPDGTLSP